MWTLPEAVDLCRQIEAVCPAYGCHVALTGGVLYKDGPRPDLDLVFYRIRQVDEINIDGLLEALAKLGVSIDQDPERHDYGDEQWHEPALYQGKSVDLFFPDPVRPDMLPALHDEPPEF